MGVGLYSVSCGYGCGYGFGGFASLIAMVLALRAREALRMGTGGKVFSGPSLSWLARRCALSVGIRSSDAPHGDGREGVFGNPPFHGSLVGAPGQWGFARTGLPFGPNLVSAHAHRMPLRHSGRPVQHLHRPSRSSAWFKGGETPPSELRTLPSPFTFTPPSVRG